LPIYEYQCSVCHHRFEVLQKVGGDGSKLKCPQCGVANPKKVFSVFSSGDASGRPSAGCSTKGFS
jgi:putative FmdB family regulatory protein